MFGLITQLFSSPALAAKKIPLYPRQVALSGNVFHFAMPEDFSKDMPAEDMVEHIDITDLDAFKNGEYGNIIRRWWDIKEPGWFGKNLGTIMMNIAVLPIADNKRHVIHTKPYDIRDRVDFMFMLDDAFHQRYDQLNKEIGPNGNGEIAYHAGVVHIQGRDLSSIYIEANFNQQEWIWYGAAAPESTLLYVYNLPLTPNLYLEASFHFAHNKNASAWAFKAAAENKIEGLLNSFKMDYAPGNPFNKIVTEDWPKMTNTQALQSHHEAILKWFYGPDPEATLRKLEQESKEFNEKLRQEQHLISPPDNAP